jgi:hypothetical protein
MLNNLLTFSVPIGYAYYGRWESRKRLAIFIGDEAGAGPPTIGGLTIGMSLID